MKTPVIAAALLLLSNAAFALDVNPSYTFPKSSKPFEKPFDFSIFKARGNTAKDLANQNIERPCVPSNAQAEICTNSAE
ncbi:hypothetical protein [Amylibacter marinus]|nr:hypothetical protein [Amylibacter marinus]